MSSEPHPGDMRGGFLGLIIGAICVFIILYAIVRITHAHDLRLGPVKETGMLMLRHAATLLG